MLGVSSVLPAGPEALEARAAALPETRADAPDNGLYWWYVRFRMAWPEGEDASWPHFILGVSRLWLELIREFERDGDWPRAPEARYAAISEALDEHWRSEGGHALLHHLNAVFGYKEVQILRRELLRF